MKGFLLFAILTILMPGICLRAQTTGTQPEMTTLKATFVPGEATIFFDDCTDRAAGDAPPHFKIRGPGAELKKGGGVRQLTFTRRGSIYPDLKSLPVNFAFETKIVAERANAP